MAEKGRTGYKPLKLFGQEYVADTWAMANMNMIIHDMEGEVEIGDTFKEPKFRANSEAVISRERQDAVIEATWGFDGCTDIKAYMKLLVAEK